MFRNIFRPDSALMITMTQITDCIFLSLFWLVGCIPVVTAGAATAAMYDAVYHGFRKGEKNSWQQFGRSFRRNWKAGIVPTMVILVAVAALGWTGIQLWNSAVYGKLSWGVFSFAAVLLMAVLGIISIVLPMLSRFENSTAALFSNTVRLGLAHLPRTLALGMLNGAAIFLCARYVVPLFFLPALISLISTVFIEPMFRPFMPEE